MKFSYSNSPDREYFIKNPNLTKKKKNKKKKKNRWLGGESVGMWLGLVNFFRIQA